MSVIDTIDYSRLFRFGQRDALPIVMQNEVAECGLACLTMVSQYHGHDVDLRGMRAQFPSSLKGMTLAKLMQMAEEMGFHTRPLSLALDSLSELKVPCILHWDLSHFVVLKSVSRTHAVIHDPAKGRCRLPLAEVSRHFTGVALELAKKGDFSAVKSREKISLFQVTGGIRGVVTPLLTILALSLLLEVFSLSSPFYLQWILDRVIVSADNDLLTLLALIFLSMAVITPVLTAFRAWCLTKLSAIVNIQWMQNVTGHLFNLPMQWFESRSVGDVLSRAGAINSIQATLTGALINTLLDGVMSVVVLIVMFFYSPPMAVFMMVLLLLYSVLRFVYFSILRRKTEESLTASANLQSEILESIRGILTIKVTGIERLRLSRYMNKAVETSNKGLYLQRLSLLPLFSGWGVCYWCGFAPVTPFAENLPPGHWWLFCPTAVCSAGAWRHLLTR